MFKNEEKTKIILLILILIFSILNFILLKNYIARSKAFLKNSFEQKEKMYEEALIINDLAQKHYTKNLEYNNTKFYDLFIVLQGENKNKAYNIGKIAKEYIYFGNVINDVFESKNIVIMLCPTFNVLSVYEREEKNFSPSYIRYSCSRNAEWTMFMDENGDLYDVLFGIYRGNYLNDKNKNSEKNLTSQNYKIMNRHGVLSLENVEIYE
ncbi:MAG: hypothetical protein QXU20_01755 [Candidatus Woesearchaeota archaeon]